MLDADVGLSASLSPTEPAGRRLRIGILTRSLELPAWQWTMVGRLIGADYAELCVVLLAGGEGASSGRPSTPAAARPSPNGLARVLAGVYRFLDSRFTCEPDALAMKDAEPLLRGVTRLSADLASSAPELRAQVREQLQSLDLDVLISLDPEIAHEHTLACARYGTWSIYFGAGRRGFGTPPGFWEVYFNSRVIESGIEMITQPGNNARIICRTFSGIEEISVSLTMNNVYWKSLSLVPRKLEALYRTGPQKFFERIDQETHPGFDDAAAYGRPGTLHMTSHILRTLKRRAVNMTQRVVMTRPWILLFHFGDTMATSMRSFHKLIPPRDRYWADPFVIERDGRHYVFFEEYINATSKAHICVLAVDGRGHYGTPIKVLDRPYHLSYPFIFEDDGTLYMVPESYDNRTVELYRCTQFPLEWEFVENLLEDICAVDSTLLHYQGKWWMFANVVQDRGASAWEELFLYYSDRLVGGTWTPHPLNPVVSDVRCSRPAGAIFIENGRLYRPAQDCSVRYGYGIRIRHITRLSEDDYAEVEVAAIEPHWDKSIVATHTLNHAGRLTVMDALQPRVRL